MSRLKTMFDLAKQKDIKEFNRAIGNRLSYAKMTRLLPDKPYLKMLYWLLMGEKLNLSDPKTFNEKLQWLKLHNRNPEYCRMVDKQEAKQYAADIIGDEYIIPTLGIWDRFENIDFESLPSRFVLKCTHDSGSVVICKDKNSFDKEKAKARIDRGLKNDLFWFGREWPYKDVPRKIIAEKYMTDSDSADGVKDYKFFCFNGKVGFFKVDFDRCVRHRANYYDPDGNLLPFGEKICPPDFDKTQKIPEKLPQMIEMAEKLSAGIDFLRVDFYYINGQIYFGEVTFYPASGFGAFVPENWDMTLGSYIKLTDRNRIGETT